MPRDVGVGAVQRPCPKAARPAARPLRAERGAAGQANRPSCCCCRHRGPVQVWPPGLPQAGRRRYIGGSPSLCILTGPILCRQAILESEAWPVLFRAFVPQDSSTAGGSFAKATTLQASTPIACLPWRQQLTAGKCESTSSPEIGMSFSCTDASYFGSGGITDARIAMATPCTIA